MCKRPSRHLYIHDDAEPSCSINKAAAFNFNAHLGLGPSKGAFPSWFFRWWGPKHRAPWAPRFFAAAALHFLQHFCRD